MSRMYSREDLNTRVKNILDSLSQQEKRKQLEMADSFGTSLYELVYTQVCFNLKQQYNPTERRYAKRNPRDRYPRDKSESS